MTNDINPKVIGNLLYKLREMNNLTQDELAKELDVTKSAVSQWESGETGIKTEKLYQIAKYFNITIQELIKGKLDIEGDEEYFNRNFNLDDFGFFEEVNDSNYYEVFEYLTRCNNVVKRLMKLYPLFLHNKCTKKQHDEFRKLFRCMSTDYEYVQRINLSEARLPSDLLIEELRTICGCKTEKEIDFELRKIFEMKMKVRPLSLLKYGKDINLIKLYFSVVGMEKANELLTFLCNNKSYNEIENDFYVKQLLSIGALCYYTNERIYVPSYNEHNLSFLKSLEGKIVVDTKYSSLIKMFDFVKTGIRCDDRFDEFHWKSYSCSAEALVDKDETNKICNTIFLKNDKPLEYLNSELCI